MKLQLALDCNLNKEKAIEIIKESQEYVDIVEIGTPFILEHGCGIITELSKEFKDVVFLADIKLIDAGIYETNTVCEAGAKISTALAAADDCTLIYARDEAHRHGAELLVDMIAVKDIVQRVKEMEELGMDYICLHTADDIISAQSEFNLDKEYLAIRKIVSKAQLVISGGITLDNMENYKKFKADVLIVGGDICRSKNPKQRAKEIKGKMVSWNA